MRVVCHLYHSPLAARLPKQTTIRGTTAMEPTHRHPFFFFFFSRLNGKYGILQYLHIVVMYTQSMCRFAHDRHTYLRCILCTQYYTHINPRFFFFFSCSFCFSFLLSCYLPKHRVRVSFSLACAQPSKHSKQFPSKNRDA